MELGEGRLAFILWGDAKIESLVNDVDDDRERLPTDQFRLHFYITRNQVTSRAAYADCVRVLCHVVYGSREAVVGQHQMGETCHQESVRNRGPRPPMLR